MSYSKIRKMREGRRGCSILCTLWPPARLIWEARMRWRRNVEKWCVDFSVQYPRSQPQMLSISLDSAKQNAIKQPRSQPRMLSISLGRGGRLPRNLDHSNQIRRRRQKSGHEWLCNPLRRFEVRTVTSCRYDGGPTSAILYETGQHDPRYVSRTAGRHQEDATATGAAWSGWRVPPA
jgi:hypothetical protein